jgi:hypothetical protein
MLLYLQAVSADDTLGGKRMNGMHRIMIVNPGPAICDFCGSETVVRRYHTEDFTALVTGPIVHESCGDWAACGNCSLLIDAEDREGLCQRSLESIIHQDPSVVLAGPKVVGYLQQMQGEFFDRCRGYSEYVPS